MSMVSTVPNVATHLVGPQFVALAETAGMVVYEPFGGMCAGLEMVLRGGFTVRHYLYQDTSPVVQRVAQHRVGMLMAQFPAVLAPAAVAGMLTALPPSLLPTCCRAARGAANNG